MTIHRILEYHIRLWSGEVELKASFAFKRKFILVPLKSADFENGSAIVMFFACFTLRTREGAQFRLSSEHLPVWAPFWPSPSPVHHCWRSCYYSCCCCSSLAVRCYPFSRFQGWFTRTTQRRKHKRKKKEIFPSSCTCACACVVPVHTYVFLRLLLRLCLRRCVVALYVWKGL